MVNEIIRFIDSHIPLSENETDIIKELYQIRTYKKGTVLLSEGAFAKECYFILKGCVRSYYVVDGEEKTTEFYTEKQEIVPISYITKQPSEYYLSCLEDCSISLSANNNEMLVEKIPRIKSLITKLNTEMMVQNQISFDNFKKYNPEMRYLKLMETRPDLFNRVPQYHLATYLGITPVSLSRLRKRISAKPTK